MLQNNDFLNNLVLKIKKKELISPFLFLGSNTELLNSKISDIGVQLLQEFNIPKIYLYKLVNDGNKIKISDIKRFLEPSKVKPTYEIQIFLIEDISRMTLSCANSCLKFFEEPGLGNIILLTNTSESKILDTILSRVNIQKLGLNYSIEQDTFYYSLISDYLGNKNKDIFSYFFKSKLEKEDQIKFLNNLVQYSKNNLVFIDYLDELNEDINSILNNNVSAKYIIDKWIIKIKSLST